MKQFNTDTEESQLPEGHKPTYIKEQHNNNCQQFFGPIINGTFIMPAAQPSNIAQPQAKESENGVASGATSEEAAAATEENEGIIGELLPVFKQNEREAQKFLDFARSREGTMVTKEVSRLSAEGKIDNKYAKSTLYEILKRHGIYTHSLSNWNKQVKLHWD